MRSGRPRHRRILQLGHPEVYPCRDREGIPRRGGVRMGDRTVESKACGGGECVPGVREGQECEALLGVGDERF